VGAKDCKGCSGSPSFKYSASDSWTSGYLPCDQESIRAIVSSFLNSFFFSCGRCLNGTQCGFQNEYETCAPDDPTQICVLNGTLVTDTIAIPDTLLTAKVKFGDILFSNITFPGPITGILGLAQRPSFNEETVFASLVEQTGIDNAFSMCVAAKNGMITLGGWDSKYYRGDVEWIKNIGAIDGDYGVNMLNMSMKFNNENEIWLPNTIDWLAAGSAIIDSGTYSVYGSFYSSDIHFVSSVLNS